jgi:hypothetical protein
VERNLDLGLGREAGRNLQGGGVIQGLVFQGLVRRWRIWRFERKLVGLESIRARMLIRVRLRMQEWLIKKDEWLGR